MELAGPMQKQQSTKPPMAAHSRCFEQLCFTMHNTVEILLSSTKLLWLPHENHCLTHTGSRSEHLLSRYSIFLSAIQKSINPHRCPRGLQWPPCPGSPMARQMFPTLWSSWSEMDQYFQIPSACCSYVLFCTGIKAEKDVLFLPMLPLALSSEADFTVTFDFTNTMQASLERVTNLAASCRWHGKSSPSSVVLL